MGCLELKHHIGNALTGMAATLFQLREGNVKQDRAILEMEEQMMRIQAALSNCSDNRDSQCWQCMEKWRMTRQAIRSAETWKEVNSIIERVNFG